MVSLGYAAAEVKIWSLEEGLQYKDHGLIQPFEVYVTSLPTETFILEVNNKRDKERQVSRSV